MNQSEHTETYSFETAARDVKKIQLQFTAEEIQVHTAVTDRVIIQKRSGNGEFPISSAPMQIDLADGILHVCNVQEKFRPVMERSRIVLYLPEIYNGDIAIDVHSGAVTVENLQGETLECHLKSGKFRLNNCTFRKQVSAAAHSGSLEFEKAAAPIFQLECFSGSLRCRRIVCSAFVAETHSGKQDLEIDASESCLLSARSGKLDFCGRTPLLKTSTKSGVQHLEAENVKKADLTALSGTIKLTVHNAKQLEGIDLHLISGRASLLLPPDITPAVSFRSFTGTYRCQNDAFAADGRTVPVNADMKTGTLHIAPC